MSASSRAAWTILAATVAIAPGARGAEPSRAELLFQEARSLLAQKRYDEACAKLAESDALDPGIGTQFNLARCYEMSGRFASARAVYERVVNETHAAGQTAREEVARARIEQLEPRLSRLRIVLATEANVVGLEVRIDSAPLPRDAWGPSQLVDAGRHVVRVAVAGYAPFEWSSDVTEGTEVVVEIPPLKELNQPETETAKPVPPAPRNAAQPAGGSTRRTVALVLGGSGVAALGTGLAFGVYSWSREGDSRADCKGNVCNPRGSAARSDALQAGDVATVLAIAGGAAVASCLVLLVTAPGRHPSGVRAAPMLAAGRAGIVLRTDW